MTCIVAVRGGYFVELILRCCSYVITDASSFEAIDSFHATEKEFSPRAS
jgi:hypothetical protein